jgi:two-component system, OmpR family, response regulator VanR
MLSLSVKRAGDVLSRGTAQGGGALRLRALGRRRAHNRPPVREIAGLRLDEVAAALA